MVERDRIWRRWKKVYLIFTLDEKHSKMKNTFRCCLILLAIALLTSGCLRLATSPTVDLAQFTPQAEASSPVQVSPPDLPVPTATPVLDAVTVNTLRLYPLWVGSTWVYDYLGYTAEEEAHWRLTETVVSSRILGGYYVVEVERKGELTQGDPSPDFPFFPPTGSLFYLLDGTKVYQFEGRASTDLNEAWLDLILPFPAGGEAWQPDPADRANPEQPAIGSRVADGPFEQLISENGARTCYHLVTRVAEGSQEATFCEGIGYLHQEAGNLEGEGYRMEMIGFVIQ